MSATLAAERIVADLFDGYEAVVSAMDAAGVAGFYEYPCIIAVPGASLGYDHPSKLAEAMNSVFAKYRQHGVASLAIRTLSWNTMSAEFLKAEVEWCLADAEGAEVVSFDTSYVLRNHGDSWRICYAVSMEEAEKLSALAASE